MNTLKKWQITFFIAFFALGFSSVTEVKAQGGDRVSFQTFYNELEPYGRWINEPEYGYVWIPDVERNFQPYSTNGHWVVTEYGNTWVSDYSWGWAPFHYGRWEFNDYYGWFWVPDDEWGPAWVSWRSSGDYYGWAPLPPRVSIHVSVNIPLVRWVFVPRRYITSHRIHHYCVPRTRIRNVYHTTYIINNYYERDNRRYVYGPRKNDIERSIRRPVVVHKVGDAARPGRAEIRNGSVNIYRPEVNGSPGNSRPARNTALPTATRGNASRPATENRLPERSSPPLADEGRSTDNRGEEIRTRPSRTTAPVRDNAENRGNTRSTSPRVAAPGAASSSPAPDRGRPQRNSPTNQRQGERRPQETQIRPRTESSRPSSQPQRRESGESDRSSSRSGGRPQRG